MDCPTNYIHEIDCPVNKNDYTVNWFLIIIVKFFYYVQRHLDTI